MFTMATIKNCLANHLQRLARFRFTGMANDCSLWLKHIQCTNINRHIEMFVYVKMFIGFLVPLRFIIINLFRNKTQIRKPD